MLTLTTALIGIKLALVAAADEALTRGPYSVLDKTTLPPSGNAHDYFHPAPYFWPNPATPNGLPYVMRDGVRIPGTVMYEPESERYDRTRLQRVFDDTRVLCLAWRETGERRYLDHARAILVRFFIEPDTRMTRHLKYAQVRMGHNKNMGSPTGLIETKDLYFYLKAVLVLTRSGVLSSREIHEFRAWLTSYLNWLLKSKQGVAECRARNNHGIYYDLQVAAIAAVSGNAIALRAALSRAVERIPQHFAIDGSQPHELLRETSQHYCCFNLQGWIHVAEIGKRYGLDLWRYRAPNGASLAGAVRWLMELSGKDWSYRQIDAFDRARYLPIWFAAVENGIELAPIASQAEKRAAKAVFHPHDGIKPFWQMP
ncbi:alginate lyase family protein [Ancylobacter sonchi]|uniref:alginate lyase family protein n=1 Tax=Ancylobacter sonchi TaxID=1937790 RepID=UPI001BD375F0|nr:alginate lyase family protein [Ancylobacter sonchi]MBS7532597.1 alginate lyase family protein [Ancylobacter sonchi]